VNIPKLKALVSTHHTAFLGKTGSGKSNASKVIVEAQLAAGERVCIIDPTGAWWGLRLNPDGSASKFKVVIFGGLYADVPITGDHGAVVAEVVATSSTPAIVDTRQMTVGERTRFFTDFAETLLRKNRGPLNLVIDEAHVFAPQGTRAADPMSGKMLHAANNLVSLGRSSGLRISLITQRPAKLHKDSLTQVETMIALRVIHPLDRAAVEAWIKEWATKGQGDEIVSSLPSLPTGDAWIWSPEAGLLERWHFPLARTFDSGKPLEEMPELAPIDLNTVHALLGKAAETLEAVDPKALQRRIAQLENQLRHAAPAPDYPDQRDLVERQQDEIKRLRLHINALLERAASIAAMEPPPTIIIATEDGIELPSQFPRHIRGQTVEEAYVVPEKVRGDGKLNAAALDLAALLKGAGDSKAYAWDSLLVMGGYRPNSGWIRKARTDLLENGLMEVDGAFVRPTDKLRADSLVTARRPPTPAELRELWTAKLRGPGGKMASWLSKYGPASRAEIAAGCGFSSNAGWTRKGFKDLLGSNLAHDRGETLAPNPLLVD
jgi:hypothetical protein